MCDEHKEEVEHKGCDVFTNSKCEGETEELHSCSFREEIYGDMEPTCRCCSSCSYLCYLET